MTGILRFLKDESGAAAAEYALILGLIAVAIVLALNGLSASISGAITNAAGQI